MILEEKLQGVEKAIEGFYKAESVSLLHGLNKGWILPSEERFVWPHRSLQSLLAW